MSKPEPMQSIHLLGEAAINRIAAGEVVERPASAVKELVENALDAGASRIVIDIAQGGKTLIRVGDNGHGIAADELDLAVARHATSKIDGSDLFHISSFGFRGEALASMGAVGRLTITSRQEGADEAAQISVHGGRVDDVKPAGLGRGSIIELRDLFYATPARLKFLRSDRAETQAIVEHIRKLALIQPLVGFSLNEISPEKTRSLFRADPVKISSMKTGSVKTGQTFEDVTLFGTLRQRIGGVLGKDFIENALDIDFERDGLRLLGVVALPTYSRGTQAQQFIYVNGRPVQDKLLSGALRAAYFDFLSRDRYGAAVLNIIAPYERVDVNVHPAKSEVRFREPDAARSLLISGIRRALVGAGHRSSSTLGQEAVDILAKNQLRTRDNNVAPDDGLRKSASSSFPLIENYPQSASDTGYKENTGLREKQSLFHIDTGPPVVDEAGVFSPSAPIDEIALENDAPLQYPLGAARAQLHENYIVAQTPDGIVIVDQHAAHERLVYEKLKAQYKEHGIASQALLIPDIVELSPTDSAMLLDNAEGLAQLGLSVEPFGGNAVVVRAAPALLGVVNAEAMIHDIIDELSDRGASFLVEEKILAVLSRMACHGSVRSGRVMRVEEMNALLREMEQTPYSGQCNHGRPTYVMLKLNDIERLFGRK